MSSAKLLGYGAWRSPITSDQIVAQTIRLSQLKTRGDEIFWVEARPAERGRNVVVRRTSDGSKTDINPLPFNARSQIHEYGGGAYLLTPDGVIFTHFDDQMLYRQEGFGDPLKITRVPDVRFADGVFVPDSLGVICVSEDHSLKSGFPRNTLVGIDVTAGEVMTLVQGSDFYSSPKLSPDGKRLAWLSWNLPNMPWDGSELWVAEVLEGGGLSQPQRIAGGQAESIFQPEWSPGGVLHFVSDRSGWWNIYRWVGGKAEPVLAMKAEFGQPQWTLGSSLYAFLDEATIICAYAERGFWKLGRLDLANARVEQIPIPYLSISDVRTVPARAVIMGSAPGLPSAVVEVDLASGRYSVLHSSTSLTLDSKYISIPESVEFPTTGGSIAFALYYAPKNDDFAPQEGELPPLVVKVHGGPTAATTAALDLNTQFWTSRGFAVVDVNYRGSSGYGRAYRDMLRHSWGVVDLEDCANAARFLARAGKVDGDRMAISGGSAGGYTALCALTFTDVFRAGTSLYGISDLEALLKDTHKFESQYPLWLIGPYPEAKQVYHDRSPVHFAEQIQCPILFLQGEEDKVVPPNQTAMMAQALHDGGKLFGLIMFAGEQHGFRKADSIQRALEAELLFYSMVLTRAGLRAGIL